MLPVINPEHILKDDQETKLFIKQDPDIKIISYDTAKLIVDDVCTKYKKTLAILKEK